ncbi:MAG: pitrilysin family protein [Patescibacteria group bacterium]|nr:pitrilysin family protein [Patescibacteria group bacterium]
MKPKVHTLKNGMSAILVPQKGAESMTLFVLVKVGSRYETRAINGASHFIEHLMFKGTEKRPNTEIISRELDRYGAEYNAYTDKDITAYYIKMDAAKTTLAVDMLYDMLFHSKYDPEEIERERGVIIEEINMYEDNPRMHVDDLVEEALFPDSTLGWNIAGPRETIRKVSREELIAYRDAYYIPKRMTVVMAGKVSPDALNLLEKTFGTVKRPVGRDKRFDVFKAPKRLRDATGLQNKQTEQVQFAMSFHGLKMQDSKLPAASLLSTIMGGTMSSRLFIQIRERRGLCYSISSGHQAREDVGLFTILAGLDKTRMPEAIKAIIHELKDVVKNGVTDEELKRAKDHIRGRVTLAFEDSATQAEWYGKDWLFRGRIETSDERMRRFAKVTKQDVHRLAGQIFDPAHMATAVIGPYRTKDLVRKMIRW